MRLKKGRSGSDQMFVVQHLFEKIDERKNYFLAFMVLVKTHDTSG